MAFPGATLIFRGKKGHFGNVWVASLATVLDPEFIRDAEVQFLSV
jgi:hypothetical protein